MCGRCVVGVQSVCSGCAAGVQSRGGQSEAMLIYGNYFHTLNGAQNTEPLINANGVHFFKHTLNGANFLNIPLMAPFFQT